MKQFFGKYRGQVTNNADPERIGRVQITVPDVFPHQSRWAMPCLPFAGAQTGFLALPAVGASVWIEFERGDADFPVWTGSFWTSPAEVPPTIQTLQENSAVVIESATGNALQLSNSPLPLQGILLKTASGAMISLSDIAITIANGKGAIIELVGPSVIVNNKPM